MMSSGVSTTKPNQSLEFSRLRPKFGTSKSKIFYSGRIVGISTGVNRSHARFDMHESSLSQMLLSNKRSSGHGQPENLSEITCKTGRD